MNKNELIKRINFCNDLVQLFSKYASKVDAYFKDEENRNNHKELYDYYKELINNINDLKSGKKK